MMRQTIFNRTDRDKFLCRSSSQATLLCAVRKFPVLSRTVGLDGRKWITWRYTLLWVACWSMATAEAINGACRALRSLTAAGVDQATVLGDLSAAIATLEQAAMTKPLLQQTNAGTIVNSAIRRIQPKSLRSRVKKLITVWKSIVSGSQVFHKPRQRRSVPDGAVVPVVPVKGHVPPLQTLCLNQIRVQIGRVAALNEVFPTSLLLAMVENAKAQDLARIERHNPDVANDLSPCWEKVVRLDLPEQYRSIQNPNSLPPDFWRKFYENTLSDRQKKTEEYADTLSSRKQKLEQDKIGSSIKKLSFSAGIVKKAMKRSRDLSCSSATPVLKDRRPKPGNGKLAKLLAPAKARLKMETKLHK